MRSLLTVRFAAAVGGVVALALIAFVALVRTGPVAQIVSGAPPTPHRVVDLLAPVYKTTAAPGFAVVDGVTTTRMVLSLDTSRRLDIAPGTPADVTCPHMGEISQCAVAAQLMGDAVVWFALVEALPRTTLVLPAVREMLDDNRLLLANGWDVARSNTVERVCTRDTDSLSEFITTFGDAATSTYSFERGTIFRVTCPQSAPAPESTPTDSMPPHSTPTGAVPGGSAPGVEGGEPSATAPSSTEVGTTDDSLVVPGGVG